MQRTPLNADNPKLRTPWYAHVTPWMLIVLIALGGTFAVDLGHQHGPLIAAGLVGLAVVSFALAFWSLGRRSLLEALPRENIFSESSPDGLLITDQKGNFLHANPAFHTLLSFAAEETPGREVASLNAIVEAVGTFEGADDLRRLVTSVLDGRGGQADISIPSFDSISWRRISARRGAVGGGAGCIFWRVEDVTGAREIENIRRLEDARLIDYIDYLPVGFFSADAEGVIRYANQTLARWLGLPPDRLIGMPFSEYVADVGEDGQLSLRDSEGRLFDAALEQSQLDGPDGEIAYTRSVVFRDMVWLTMPTPPMTAALEESVQARAPDSPDVGIANERLHWLFDEAPVGMIMLDLSGEITDCNRAFLKLIGRHRDALLGEAFAERVSKEDRGDVTAALSKIVMGTARATHMEVRLPGVGAIEYTISLYASPLGDADGDVHGIVLYLIDATEQKNLEVQFAQSQKMQAVGQLAGGVAHDFNNLLTAMIGFCDLLLTRHGPDDPSFADIQQIRQNANRATNLVRQLLAFSRKQTLQPVRLELSEALSDLSNLIRRLIGETVTLTMELGSDIWPVKGDRNQFDQIIINLCVNARDAMPGGGDIAIRTQNVHVDAPIQRGHDLMPASDYVRIDVADTGTGISKENMERIFDPFFTTKEAGAGTGLGLSTVYGIVHQSGGFIFVDSAPGEGTTFTIYLPRFEDGIGSVDATVDGAELPPETATVLPANGDLTGQGTVLLVEDEDAVRMFGSRALKNKGYYVLEAANGEIALDVINATEKTIDIIVSDVIMPGMDGHTLVNLVRQEMPDMKVILMSGYAEDMLEEIERDPSLHFLGKPFTLKDLAAKVKDVLEA